MKYLLLILTVLTLAITASAQRTIENPAIGARSSGACTGIFIDKIELSDKLTKVFMTNYHGYKEGWFKMVSTTSLRAGNKRWTVLNAEGIDLDTQVYPKDDVEFVTHFVLNFPAIDKNLDAIDFIELDDLNGFNFYEIALTDSKAEEIKKRYTFPEELRNYNSKITDNGKSLELNGFTMEPATVKGKIFNFDNRTFGDRLSADFMVYIYNPFLADQITYSGRIYPDGTFEVKVPMTTKHQAVYVAVSPIISNDILISAGKTVEVYYDFQQIYKPWELPNNRLIPYFAGENADINYSISLGLTRNIYSELLDNPTAATKVSKFTMAEFKDYVMNYFVGCNSRIDAMPITKRAKEYQRIALKAQEAYYLSMGQYWIEAAYRNINGKNHNGPNSDFKRPEMDKDYLNYPKLIGIDEVMMFYANDYSYNITGWEMCFNRVFNKYRYWDDYVALNHITWMELDKYQKIPKKEQSVFASIKKKMQEADTSRTEAEVAFTYKYASVVDKHIMEVQDKCAEGAEDFKNEIFGEGGSFFKDFIKLQEYCQPLNRQTVVPDSIVAEIEKMRIPFYAEYVKAKNAEVSVKIEAEKARGGYHLHQVGESEGDSLFVDLIKDFKGKVVFIDFWNTWCGPCRQAIKQMAPMEKSFEDKDVVFLFIADESSPKEEYDGMIVSMKGHHYRLTERQSSTLKQKWGFTGIPSYVIVGKDGMVKDFHTGFKGNDYYKNKIEEELNK
ncbi:MAG: TlpA family protein disulfide reductase [Bacteroidales bacterium]|nr:TlpA family protein disulfide reductase [Bacteroidales bacterium]